MSFQPIIPFGGAAGWEFLQRTRERQQDVFDSSATIQRNTDAFRARIASVASAEELVADRALREVALGAFGLDEDIDNKFLIARVLESDTTSRDSLTSKFADKRYEALSDAFGFGSSFGPRIADRGFADRIIDAYRTRQFEVAVGDQAPDLRLAMGIERDLGELVSNDKLSPNGAWFSVMANKPLRSVFETALGLPTSFGTLDLDRQLSTFRQRSEATLGISEISDFADPAQVEELRRLFLVRSQLSEMAQSFAPSTVALTLMSQTAPRSRF